MSLVGDAPGDAASWESIPAMTTAAADRHGDRLAISDGDTRISYAELHEQARTFGGALVASGVEAGDRVAIWAPNGAEWVVAALGLLHAGAVLVPINTRFKGAEAADILSRSRATALVTVTDFLDTDYVAMLHAADVQFPDLETILVASGAAPAGTVPWDGFLARATDAGRAEVDRRSADISAGYPSDILFTSGTTGQPKGVVMTHGRTLGVATDWVRMTGLSADDRYLMVNPYFHMFGLKAGILACVAAGAAMLPEAVFEVDRVLARVTREGVTVLPGSPTLYQSILDHPDRDRYDLSSLRAGTIGAADIPVELVRRIFDELPYSVMISGYGLTEAGTASGTLLDDDPATIATTVGLPRPGFEIRIIDPAPSGRDRSKHQPMSRGSSRAVGGDTGSAPDSPGPIGQGDDVPAGETGEIALRSPTVMAGYLDDPEATAQAVSPDGWLRTGDLGVLDERGYLRIVGRSKDMFIVGGFNAYPAEIENALLRHPEVRQAAVIGIPDKRLGEAGMAFLVTESGDKTDIGGILAWCRDQMANYKVPRAIEVVAELPLNATGKVVKDELRARVAPGQ